MKHKVVIVSSSYGADYIKQVGGQYNVVPIVKAANAYGIEIRRELFSIQEFQELPKLNQQIKRHGLVCFYSVPFHLFVDNGMLNQDLQSFLQEAKQLGAQLIKFSLGYFNKNSYGSLDDLKKILTFTDIQLVVENDQTECGVIEPFEDFFKQINMLSIPIKMTFDTGNWLCLNTDPLDAAQRLGQYIGYIHVKAAKLIKKGKIAASPPTENDDWMLMINSYLPGSAFRGIEFPLIGDDLESVSRKYVTLLN